MSDRGHCPVCGGRIGSAGEPCPKCLLTRGLECTGAPRLGPGFLDDLPLPGDSVVIADKYTVIETIARGGMGVVYKARQENLNRIVAVKMLLGGVHASDDFKRRFLQEAKAAAGLNHPNIVSIHDWGEDSGQPFFSMDYVEGRTLAEMAREQPLASGAAAEIVRTLAEAMHYAHGQGVLHRDLKPSNVLVDVVGVPHITDFGLARELNAGKLLTVTGEFMGTPGFLPPEQICSKCGTIGPPSDVYGLGAILYYLLCSRPPHMAGTAAEAVLAMQENEPVAPRRLNASVPRDLETICLKCLAKEPSRRYASAKALAEDLGNWLADRPIHARLPGPGERAVMWARRNRVLAWSLAAIAAIVLVGTGGVAWNWQQAVSARRQTQAANRELEKSIALSWLDLSESMNSGNGVGGLPHLAALVRRNPSNALAAERLDAAIHERDWCLPQFQPVRLGSNFNAAMFSPDGLRVAAGGSDAKVTVYDAQTGEARCRTAESSLSILALTFSDDGRTMATGAADKTARVWDTATGAPLTAPLQHFGPVNSVHMSSDGRWLLTSSSGSGYESWAQVWELPAGNLRVTITNRFYFYGAWFSPDSSRFVTVSTDKSARLWETATGKLLFEPMMHSGGLVQASFSRDGRLLATASYGHSAWVWDATTGQLMAGPLMHEDAVNTVRFDSTGTRLITASEDGTARVFNPRSGQPLLPALRHDGAVLSACFSADGKSILTASADGTACLWDAATGWRSYGSMRHEGRVGLAEFSTDGKRVFTLSKDGLARTWSIHRGSGRIRWLQTDNTPLRMHCDLRSGVVRVATTGPLCERWSLSTGQRLPARANSTRAHTAAWFSLDGTRLLTTGDDWRWHLWNSDTGVELGELTGRVNDAPPPHFSADGRKVALVIGDAAIGVWSTIDGAGIAGPLPSKSPPDVAINAVKFSPDGARLATAAVNDERMVRLWDVARGLELALSIRPTEAVTSLAFTSDGQRLAGGSAFRDAHVWDVATGREACQPLFHGYAVRLVKFNSDGRRLYTAAEDNVVRIWDMHTGELRAPPLRHGGTISELQLSRDGGLLLTVAGGSIARVWDAATGEPLTPPLRHDGRIVFARLAGDNPRVITAARDGYARVWDARTGVQLHQPLAHGAPIVDAMFDEQEQQLVTAAENGRIAIWTIRPPVLPVADWLPKLAEALAGERLDKRDRAEPAPADELQRVINQFLPERTP